MNDFIMSAIALFAMSSLGLLATNSLPKNEQLLPRLSLLAHMLTAPALLAIMDYIFVASDVHYYFRTGETLTKLMRSDPLRWIPETFKFMLQLPNGLEVYFPEQFSGAYATTSMAAAVSFVMLLLNDAQYASFIFMAGLAYLAKLASYRGVRLALPNMNPSRVAIAMMLVPSVVFWSSGIVKESFALIGLGILMLWISRATKTSLWTSPHLLLTGVVLLALIKPYLLFPFILSAGTWIGLVKLKGSNLAVKPIVIIAVIVLFFSALAGLSVAFPEFSLSKFGESTSHMQQAGATTDGGSNYNLGNAEATSLSGQLAFAPIALTTVLVRPFFFEIRNFSMGIASIESTILLYLLIQLFRKNTVKQVFRAIRSSPPLAYCLVYTLVAGLAIGLATSNFGTLSRYRIPMMPYYTLLVLVLTDKRSGVTALRRAEAATPSVSDLKVFSKPS
ncbi:MAG: hypothetical protein Q8Q09_07555 [Deltaproteobacteria bacterium]|nr:hypothetical protein [Deltaproteobacteria bacterium]